MRPEGPTVLLLQASLDLTSQRGTSWPFKMLLVWPSVWESGAGGRGAARRSAVPCGPGRGINSRARLARTGIVQSYLQTTLALLFIEPALFLPAVTSERRRATETVG